MNLKSRELFPRKSGMLNHTVRKRGQPHQTLLEVADFDPETGSSFVASYSGKQSDWYLNIPQKAGEIDCFIMEGEKVPLIALALQRNS